MHLAIGTIDAATRFVSTRINPFGCGHATGGTADVFPGERIDLHDHDVMDHGSGNILHGTPAQPIARYLTTLGGPFTIEPYSEKLHGNRTKWVDEGKPVPDAPGYIHKHGTINTIGPWEF